MKPFSTTLALLGGGQFQERLANELADLVKNVDETGKAGVMTITLALKKTGGAISIAPKVTCKTPEAKDEDTLLWPTVEGSLVLDNPAQLKLPLAQVTAAPRSMVG